MPKREGDVEDEAEAIEAVADCVKAEVEEFVRRGEPPGGLAGEVLELRVAPRAFEVEVDGQGVFHVEVQLDDGGAATPLLVVVVGHGIGEEIESLQEAGGGGEVSFMHEQIEIGGDAEGCRTVETLGEGWSLQGKHGDLRGGEGAEEMFQLGRLEEGVVGGLAGGLHQEGLYFGWQKIRVLQELAGEEGEDALFFGEGENELPLREADGVGGVASEQVEQALHAGSH